jgi:hypothetical protein
LRTRLAVLFVIGCSGVWAQGNSPGNGQGNGQGNGPGQNAGPGNGDPFIDQGDDGRPVKVMPIPELVNTPGNPPTIAPSSYATTAYSATYGSGSLINHGGYEIPSASFQPIYWNSTVSGSTATSLKYSSLSAEIGAFVTVFADGKNYSSTDSQSDYTILQQYGKAQPIANTLTKLADFVDKQTAASKYTDTQIQTYLTALFNTYGTTGGKAGLKPSSSVIYGLYFPSGMQVCLTSGCSCSAFCGYHSHFAFGNTQIKYAVFPYPNCSSCSMSGMTVADMLTIIGSHEIGEAITDPGDFGNMAWFDANGYEAYDKCAWHNLYQLNRPTQSGLSQSFWVQPVYSNGGTVSASGFIGTYPGPGCVIPSR